MSFLVLKASYMLNKSTTKYQAAIWHQGMRKGDLEQDRKITGLSKPKQLQYMAPGEEEGRPGAGQENHRGYQKNLSSYKAPGDEEGRPGAGTLQGLSKPKQLYETWPVGGGGGPNNEERGGATRKAIIDFPDQPDLVGAVMYVACGLHVVECGLA